MKKNTPLLFIALVAFTIILSGCGMFKKCDCPRFSLQTQSVSNTIR
jgi:hypothetical protein